MGEDFPLDPDQVQPPHEGQPDQQPHEGDTTHIEVTSREPSTEEANPQDGGDGRIEDVDKAWDMAEAGDERRTKAAESRNEKTAWKHEKSFPSNYTSQRRAEFYDEAADKAETAAGEVYDEAQSSPYSKNVDKAKEMIWAERERKQNLSAPTAGEVGARYELEAANEQIGTPQAEALKGAPSYDMAKIFLRYSRVIAENYRKHGDDLSVNLQALEVVAQAVSRYGTHGEFEFGKFVSVNVNDKKDGAIDISTSGRNIGNVTEKWHIPMFDDDPKSSKHTGTYARPRDIAYYEITESAPDPDGGFDRVQTTKTRALGDQDVANLDKLFGKVARVKAIERENTLYPGDDGYAEELAEINYGRDPVGGY